MRRPRLDPEDGAVLGYPHSTEFQFRKAGDEARGRDREMGKRERGREGEMEAEEAQRSSFYLEPHRMKLTFDPECGTLGSELSGREEEAAAARRESRRGGKQFCHLWLSAH